MGPPSNEVQVVVAACPLPAAPVGLTRAVSGRTVRLQWGAATGANGYVVEAGAASGQADLARLPTGGTLLEVAAPPGTYFVRVRGTSGCGVGPVSNEVIVTVQ